MTTEEPRSQSDSLSPSALRPVDEILASFSTRMARELELRGQLSIRAGAIRDLDCSRPGYTRVQVAEPEASDSQQLTLISEQPLAASERALLVYRPARGADLKLLGRLAASRLGQRQNDRADGPHIARFTIVHELR